MIDNVLVYHKLRSGGPVGCSVSTAWRVLEAFGREFRDRIEAQL
jgi:hypothetical protein